MGEFDVAAFLDGIAGLSHSTRAKLNELVTDVPIHATEIDKPPEPEPPSSIGRYEVIRELGRGAFGVVYLALDERLDREVAVKLPSLHRLGKNAMASFLKEARMVAELDHPGIVPVYDVGELEGDECYVVSKYIQGEDLRTIIRNGRLATKDAVEIVAGVAWALHHAHRRGLIHRDIKPANILIDAAGKPHVIDFGLAMRDEPIRMGQANDIVGSPAYMSPEQARGEGHRVDPRSDVFSLGVVLYELLTQTRPFTANTASEVIALISEADAEPPRIRDERVPRELDRICTKALSRRMSERFSTAADFAEELSAWSSSTESTKSPARADSGVAKPSRVETASDSQSGITRIVPKGLRSFDALDRDFFLELLPGPRDRMGLPDSIRFWKKFLEADEPTLPVGLVYGPSGCGKSSFIKAGLIPTLDDSIKPIYVEATASGFESKLSKHLGDANADVGDNLVKAVGDLRHQQGGRKVVLFVDQFEQWLNIWDFDESRELVRGLRQCDGVGVQAILMVRDDFWMSATRLMRALDVPLLEGKNSAAVDLFDQKHAMRVLRAYGQAYDALPEKRQDITTDQARFLDEAVKNLAERERVVPVRLSLFAEMVKDQAWTSSTLRATGGTEGLGVAFLEQVFGADAPPAHRPHAAAAKGVLRLLLPEPGTNIKGNVRSREELVAVSGYHGNSRDFDELMRILDSQLRLITPTETSDGSNSSTQFFQLTHDYLVPSVRNWLTRAQRATVSGRAELALEEATALWSTQPHKRLLPGPWGMMRAALLTKHRNWSRESRAMLSLAAYRLAWQTALVVALTVGVVLGVRHMNARASAESFRDQLYSAAKSELSQIIQGMDRSNSIATDMLQSDIRNSSTPTERKLRAELALVAAGSENQLELSQTLLVSGPAMLRLAGRILTQQPEGDTKLEPLWQSLEDGNEHLLSAASLLAQIRPHADRWMNVSDVVTAELLAVNRMEARQWIDLLAPIGRHLVKPIVRVCESDGLAESGRDVATYALIDFANEPTALVRLLVKSSPSQYPLLHRRIKDFGDAGIDALEQFVDDVSSHGTASPKLLEELSGSDAKNIIERAEGFLTDQFAVCQTLPLDQLVPIVDKLRAVGFRPTRARPFALDGELRVAAIWHRDSTRWKLEAGITVEEFHERSIQYEKTGLRPSEIAGYVEDNRIRLVCIWSESTLRTICDVALPTGTRERLPDRSIHHPVALHLFLGPDGQLRENMIWQRAAGSSPLIGWWSGPVSLFEERLNKGNHWLTDVALLKRNQSGGSYAALTLRRPPGFEVEETHGGNSRQQLSWMKLHAKLGYHPAAIGLAQLQGSEPPQGLTVWHRPLVPSVESLREQATAIMGLAHMGRHGLIGQHFRGGTAPTLRSYLLSLIASLGMDATALVELYKTTQDDHAKMNALLGLGLVHQNLDSQEASTLIDQLKSDYANDPHPGIHAACDWILRRMRHGETVAALREELKTQGPHPAQRWYVSPTLHEFVVCSAPAFVMGSPRSDPRRSSRERYHLRKIPRTYAIGAKEVTHDQWQHYLDDTGWQGIEARNSQSGTPVVDVNWFSCARFCNWLSEREGIPQDQWCFLPNEKGQYRVGTKLAPDYLKRTGYRIPTEAEWEFACRGKSKAIRFFGQPDELLDLYCWYGGNSSESPSPSATKMPNPLGIFDMLGNAAEPCCDLYGHYPGPGKDGLVHDRGTRDLLIARGQLRVSRGGCYFDRPSQLRCAARGYAPVEMALSRNGLRLARTLSSE